MLPLYIAYVALGSDVLLTSATDAAYNSFHTADVHETSRTACPTSNAGIAMLQKGARVSRYVQNVDRQTGIAGFPVTDWLHAANGTATDQPLLPTLETFGNTVLADILLYCLCVLIFWGAVPYCRTDLPIKRATVLFWIAIVVAFILLHSILWGLFGIMLVHNPGLSYFHADRGDGVHLLGPNIQSQPCIAVEACNDSWRSRTRCVLGGSSVTAISGAVAGCLACSPLGSAGCIKCAGTGLLTGTFPGMKQGMQSRCPEDVVGTAILHEKIDGAIAGAAKRSISWFESCYQAFLPNYKKHRP